MTEAIDSAATFEVHPSVVFKLGSDLITDDIQAIAELIKNAYDADAKTVVVRIDTSGSHAEAPGDVGYIDIVDTGTGMAIDALKRGWLTISWSPKRAFKDAGEVTALKRTPLGDKGLGRLGSQRLGHRITIITTPEGEGVTHRLSLDWRDFLRYEALSEMKVTIASSPTHLKKGTRIIVSGLHHPEHLTYARLIEELARMISPYREITNFRLGVTLNGQDLELAAQAAAVRRGAVLRYELAFNGITLHVRGLIRLGLFRPNAKKEQPEFTRVITSDKGAALLRHLKARPVGQDMKLKRSAEPGWWGEVSMEIDLATIPGYEFEPGSSNGTGQRPPANPGPFIGEIDAFNLSPGSIEEIGAFDSVREARSLLKSFAGVRVYRDGFNVRVDGDWLVLGKRWSSGGSYFGLRPATTMGYVAISAAENRQLVETTDREGFQSTPHFNNLIHLMSQFVEQSAELQEFLGREGAKFRKVALADVDAEEERDPNDIAQDLANVLGRAQAWTGPLAEVRAALVQHSSDAEVLVTRLSDRPDLSADELEMLASLNALSRHARRAQELVDELATFIGEVATQRTGAAKLQIEMEVMSEQLSMVYDTIAVGLTAEALSHEIANIATRLARRASTVNTHIRKNYAQDRQLGRFIEEVTGSVAGLRRQLAHLAPSLRFVRERREKLPLAEVVNEVSTYFQDRWADRPVRIETAVVEDFSVQMNRGKLIQVIDNLVLNSEYWLGEDLREGRIDHGIVTVTIDRPYVRIADNGRGIDPGVCNSLFEAFVSRKPRGSGRGLGLYIVRQLLDSEGSAISLLPEANEHGRPYEFEIDFSGVVA
jgi:signal transduction histidine kinase